MAFNVFQRKDGRFAVKFKSKIGNWVQKTFKTKEEAQLLAEELKERAKRNNKMTVAEVVTEYVKYRPELCQLRKDIYSKILKKGGYAEALADRLVDSLTRRDLELVRNECRKNSIKPQTINNYICYLTAAFNWAVEQELIEDNPWKKYRRLKVTERTSRKATLEEFTVVYKALPPFMQWVCRTCLALCLRPGKELMALKWENINWDKGFVRVYMFKVKEYKTVFPPQQYLEEAKEKARLAICPYVVIGAKGKRVTYGSLKKTWGNICKKVGISIPMYCMRHLAASLTIEAGANLTAVASQLGHASPKTTEQFYLHSSEEGQRKAGQALALPYAMVFNEKK